MASISSAGMCSLGTVPRLSSFRVSFVKCCGAPMFSQPLVARRLVVKPVPAYFGSPSPANYDKDMIDFMFHLTRPIWSDDAKEALKLAFKIAQQRGHFICTVDHLVVAIGEVAKRHGPNRAANHFRAFNTIFEAAKAQLEKMGKNDISVLPFEPEPSRELVRVVVYAAVYLTALSGGKSIDDLIGAIVIHRPGHLYQTHLLLKALFEAQTRLWVEGSDSEEFSG